MTRMVCFTIDVEPDFGGLLRNDIYFGKRDLPRLKQIVERYGIKLTAFVTGKTLEENPEILDSLDSMGAEIEQHSYSHRVDQYSKIKDIEQGIQAHEKYVGKRPLGYRAPQGRITLEETLFLSEMGIKFDSSIFPTLFPGRFNRLGFPLTPFLIEESDVLEIPFAVVPKLRIPIALSYMQLFGLFSYRCLFGVFGFPEILVYGFHSYELGRVESYGRLPRGAKVGYFRAQRLYKDPASVLEGFVKYILGKGYDSKYMLDIYEHVKSKAPKKKWTGN